MHRKGTRLASLIQRAFAGGEIGPPLYARCDEVKYSTGVKKLRNFILMKHGGATNRPGTIFVGEVSNSLRKGRLISFEFNDQQTYALEFGNKYVRFVQNASYLTLAPETITAITQANPGVVTVVAHGYSSGDEVAISGVLGMTELNNRNFKITVIDPNNFSLSYMDGTPVDSTLFGAYISGGTTSKVYEIVTPYVTRDLPLIKFFQSGDVITITHSKYPVSSISRLGQTNWTYSENTFLPQNVPPASVAASGGTGTPIPSYVITSVDSTTSEESLISSSGTATGAASVTNPVTVSWPAAPNAGGYNLYKVIGGVSGTYGFIGTSKALSYVDTGVTPANSDGPPTARNPFAPEVGVSISSITNANPAVVTAVGHGYQNGDVIFFDNISGMTELNNNYYIAANVTANTFELNDREDNNIDSTAFGVFTTSGIAVRYVSLVGANITAITLANPGVVTAPAHGFSNGDIIQISGVVGMTQVNATYFKISAVTLNTFALNSLYGVPTNTTTYTAYTSGGSAVKYVADPAETIIDITNANPAVVTSIAHGYNVSDLILITGVAGMTALNNLYFFVSPLSADTYELHDYPSHGNTNTTSFPEYLDHGQAHLCDKFPACGNYIQQRLTLANQRANTEAVYMSRSGQFKNFSTSLPSQANDSITFNMAGRKVNAVNHIVDIGKMVSLTATGEWSMLGDGNGVLTPSAINPQQASYYGCNQLRPIVVGNNALYVQARGSIVRDLGFKFQTQGYEGNDLTLFAPHLFEGFSLVDWDYQQTPNSIIWAVRSDGVLLGLTYIKEQEIWGWHRHDFENGFVENVCCIPNGDEDDLYLIIKRTINGVEKRYVEKLATRVVSDIKQSIFMDSALSYDGTNYDLTSFMTLSGSGWTYQDPLTITANVATFSAANVGESIILTGPDGTIIRFALTAFISSSQMTGLPDKTVPVNMRSTLISTWALGAKDLSGLWSLEGQNVAVVGDGFVIGSPNNDAYVEQYVVTDGKLTLPKTYGVIHVGIPFISDIETLDIDTPNAATISTYFKKVDSVAASVEATRGFFAGIMSPEEDPSNITVPPSAINPLKNLFECKVRNLEPMDQPVSLTTDVVTVSVSTTWNRNGGVFIRQVDPMPLTILSIVASGDIPIKQ